MMDKFDCRKIIFHNKTNVNAFLGCNFYIYSFLLFINFTLITHYSTNTKYSNYFSVSVFMYKKQNIKFILHK
jgi:hypothetical protein